MLRYSGLCLLLGGCSAFSGRHLQEAEELPPRKSRALCMFLLEKWRESPIPEDIKTCQGVFNTSAYSKDQIEELVPQCDVCGSQYYEITNCLQEPFSHGFDNFLIAKIFSQISGLSPPVFGMFFLLHDKVQVPPYPPLASAPLPHRRPTPCSTSARPTVRGRAHPHSHRRDFAPLPP